MNKKWALPINNNIQAQSVRLVNEKGEMIGIVSIDDAIAAARAANLDLVEIVSNETPPVCKILDYSKYRYENKKRIQESKKKQKTTSLKEIRFRPNIGTGDLQVKIRSIRKFLENGDKVKATLIFSGREIIYKDAAIKLFQKIIEDLGETANVELAPRMEGRLIIMILTPIK